MGVYEDRNRARYSQEEKNEGTMTQNDYATSQGSRAK